MYVVNTDKESSLFRLQWRYCETRWACKENDCHSFFLCESTKITLIYNDFIAFPKFYTQSIIKHSFFFAIVLKPNSTQLSGYETYQPDYDKRGNVLYFPSERRLWLLSFVNYSNYINISFLRLMCRVRQAFCRCRFLLYGEHSWNDLSSLFAKSG